MTMRHARANTHTRHSSPSPLSVLLLLLRKDTHTIHTIHETNRSQPRSASVPSQTFPVRCAVPMQAFLPPDERTTRTSTNGLLCYAMLHRAVSLPPRLWT